MQLLGNNYFLYQNQKFIAFILLNFIFTINCIDTVIDFICLYPRYFSLYNNYNILTCKEGIYTYNSKFEKLFFHEFDTEIISKANGVFITFAQFPNNEYVIVITERKFYLLSNQGNFLFDDDLDFDKDGSYYTLIPFKYGNNYNFVITSINSSKRLNLLYYNIDFTLNKIVLINNYVPKIKTGNGAEGSNYYYGFTCELMNLNNSDILVCFCSHGYPLEIAAFKLTINSDLEIIENSFAYLSLSSQSNFIKSIISEDKSKSLIAFVDNDSKGYFTIFDLIEMSFTQKVNYMTIRGNYASSILIQYFPLTQEYVLASNNEKEFKIVKFDKNFNRIQNDNMNDETTADFTLKDDCYGVNFFNVVLFPKYNNYIFISDGNYGGNTTARGYLFPDAYKPDEILQFQEDFTTEMSAIPSTLKHSYSSIISTMLFPQLNTSSSIIHHSSTTYSSIIHHSSTTSSSIIHHSSTISPSTIYHSSTTSSSIIHHSFTTSPSTIYYRSTTSPSKNENSEEVSCSLEYFYRNIKTNQCNKICSDYEFLNDICRINVINENNIMNVTEQFRQLLSKIEVNENINIVINGDNAVYQFISSKVMDENLEKNISIIDFGECEKKLKNMFSIDYILVLQIDIFLSTSTNIVLKYEVYNPYNLERIDLSICKDMTINTYLPYPLSDEEFELCINLNESGYDLYNPNDSFYTDICSPYTTKNKKDILLSDRRIDYYKNKSFCEEGCTYIGYDCTYEKVQCECQIKNETYNNIDGIKFHGNFFISTFFSKENFSNMKVIKCFKLVFSLYGQKMNFGSYIFIVFSLIYIVLMFLFCKNGKKKFFEIIDTALKTKMIRMPIKKRKEKKKNEKAKKIKKGNNKMIINKNIIINNNFRNINDKTNALLKSDSSTKKTNSKLFSTKKTEKFQIISGNINKKLKKALIHNVKKVKDKKDKKYETINKVNKVNKVVYRFLDIELNTLTYKEAIIHDKRTFSEYYCCLLKEKHLIIFTFISTSDFNLFIIKLSLFIFTISLYFTVNTLFFNDTTIHKIYKNETKIQLIYSLMNILYSTIINSTITLVLKFLALSNKSILKLRTFRDRKKAIKESKNLVKQFNFKLKIYFMVSFILMLTFWYFISAFCAVYRNSQIYLIENTFGSFALSLIYPFGINLIPGMFRITALRAKKKDKQCMYTFGNFISIF